MLRPGLRAKILALTALPLLALAAAALWMVDRGVSARSETAVAADLQRAGDVFENMLMQDAQQLQITGAVIVRDPRFFSVLALPHGAHDAEFRATLAGVAQDFQRIAQPDVFEVVDHRQERVGSVGRLPLEDVVRQAAVAGVLEGRSESRMVTQQGTHVLLVGTPVVADGRVVGALLLGREVSGVMASRLRGLTNSQVSFVDGQRITRTTLESAEDRAVVRHLVAGPQPRLDRPTRDGAWIGYARALPMSDLGARQYYVLQRSLIVETAFLRSVRSHLLELGLALLLGSTDTGEATVALVGYTTSGH